jgi:hypothetical protein
MVFYLYVQDFYSNIALLLLRITQSTQKAQAIQRYLVTTILDSEYESSNGRKQREKVATLIHILWHRLTALLDTTASDRTNEDHEGSSPTWSLDGDSRDCQSIRPCHWSF